MTDTDALVAVVRRALDAAEAGDADGYLACLADDVVLELPYADAEGGVRHEKAGIGHIMGFMFKTFGSMSFTIDRAYGSADGSADGSAVAIEYHSRMRSRVGDVDYANSYVGVFEFRDGLISLWREYANPAPFEQVMDAIKAAASK